MTEQEFKNEVFLFKEYDNKILDQFFDYWSEPNKKGKMKWELEKTWELKRRLARWFNNQIQWKNGSTSKSAKQSDAFATLLKWGQDEYAAATAKENL